MNTWYPEDTSPAQNINAKIFFIKGLKNRKSNPEIEVHISPKKNIQKTRTNEIKNIFDLNRLLKKADRKPQMKSMNPLTILSIPTPNTGT